MPSDDLRRIEELQREIDQTRIAEAGARLDQAHLAVWRFRADDAEARIEEAIKVLAGLESAEITKRVEYLLGEIAELREVIRK